jgi:hypothetical protein
LNLVYTLVQENRTSEGREEIDELLAGEPDRNEARRQRLAMAEEMKGNWK